VQGLNITTIPISDPIKLDVSAVTAVDLADGLFLPSDNTLEVVRRPLLHLVELDPTPQLVSLIHKHTLPTLLDPGSADEGGTELVGRISAIDDCSVPKLHSTLALVPHRQRV
jgi:hypothetical protein